VVSDLDSGGPNLRRRIDGSLSEAEKIVISFDRDVVIKALGLNQFSADGTESLIIESESGDNPFSGLSGYDANGFGLNNNSLSFSRDGGNNLSLIVRMGSLDQDELLLTAGSEISITANPATAGGIVLTEIEVAIPGFLPGDANQDGLVDLLDVAPFIQIIGSNAYQIEADVNHDGAVDLLDVEPFVELLLNGGQ